MLKRMGCLFMALCLALGLAGCGSAGSTAKKVKIGVSLGARTATRWANDKQFLEERAAEVGADIEVRLNTLESTETQKQDCFDLIDSGIDVLILTLRDVADAQEVLQYAADHKVKVLCYSRCVMGLPVDFYVGFDTNKMGQSIGLYLSESVYQGDYIILKGDVDDFNTPLQYAGSMKYLQPLIDNGSIRVLLDEYVPGWSPEEAKKLVTQALLANDKKVDAILAPNDKIAGACREVLTELSITTPVFIAGMDAELDAARRIVSGEQSITLMMNLKEVAYTAVDTACNMAQNKPLSSNTAFENGSGTPINAYLINGQVVTPENMDRVLIDGGIYPREEIYAPAAQ